MLDALDGLIKECARIHAQFLNDYQTWTANFATWLKASQSTVEAIFGTNSESLYSFNSIYFLPPPDTVFKDDTERERSNLFWFDSGLRYAHSTLIGFRYSVERLAPEPPAKPNFNIFISHGGPTRTHVDMTSDLMTALGLSPVIVMDLPNMGLSLNDKVLSYMNICAGAIVLATVEDETTAGENRTRPNVENEVGMFQSAPNICNRIVYLKEKDVQFASNYKEKAWIPFEKEHIEKSFIQIIRELRAFGFII